MLQFVPFVKMVVIALMDIRKNVQITKPVTVRGRVIARGANLVINV